MLNDVMVRNLAAPATGVAQHPDGKVPGFGVRVTAKGVKSFYLKYRLGDQYGRMNLGRYPDTSLAKARSKALTALAALADGLDPESGQPILLKSETPQARADHLFGEVIDAFVRGYCHRQNRRSTAMETERLLRSNFAPVWGDRKIGDITKSDVHDVIDLIIDRGTPSAARHAFAAIRKLFNWSVERGLIDDSPCRTMKPPVRALNRERVLSDPELGRVWRGCCEQGDTFGAVVRLLILTAQRRGEVCGMRWDELDLEAGLWSIPGARTKNHKPHIVPLTPMAIDILTNWPRLVGSPFVFPARGKPDQAYTGYSKGKRNLDKAVELHDWTLHDLRRTAATGMARDGVPPHVVERLLNHVSGTFGGVAGVYNRFAYLDEMRGALTAWDGHIARLPSKGAGTVAKHHRKDGPATLASS